MSIIRGYAQKSAIEFEHLTTADGLSQSSVMAICQDQDGMMWFGTRDGLNKYDGNKIIIYRNDPADKNTISSNDIVDLAVDYSGNLWIATYDGLNCYDVNKERFIRYLMDPSDPNSLSRNTVWSVEVVSEDEVWIGTSMGLNILNTKTGKLTQLFHDPQNPKSLSDNHIMDVYKDTSGHIWVGTAEGLNKLTKRSGNQFEFSKYHNILDKVFVQAIIEDSQKKLWVGTKFSGLFSISPGDNSIVQITSNADQLKIINDDVRALEFDEQGNLWVGTYDGISRINLSRTAVTSTYHDPLAPHSLSKNTIKCIFKSNNGSVWVGSYYGGINMWDDANFNFNTLKQWPNGAGLKYNVVSSIVEDIYNIYFGTEGGGISILDKETGEFSYLTMENSALPSNNIKSLHIDQNELWISTFNAGLIVWNKGLKKFLNTFNESTGLSSNSVYGVLPYGDNLIFIGTFGGGLNIVNARTYKVIKVLSNDPEIQTSISDNQVRYMFIDSNENLWVCTPNGLNFLSADNIKKGKYVFKHFFYHPGSKSGEDVLTIFEDNGHRIWVGNKETGLHKMKEGQFLNVNLFESYENTSNTIHAIVEGLSGVFWISSNNGIMRFNPKINQRKLYEESDGLVSNEFNDNSALLSSSGLMYFGGPDGVSFFRTADLKSNDYTPDVIITGLKIFNEKILPDDNTEILNGSISKIEEIQLDYDQANFTIDFALPSYVNHDKNAFSYRMKGLENEWTNTSGTEANFIIQNAGTYTFEVKGANNDGKWSDKTTSLDIIVHPAPWRSVWAFLIYGITICIALYMLLTIIQSRAKLRHDLELEHRDKEQQQQLNQVKLQFFTNISHEFRTPLTLILGPLQNILQEYRGSNKMFKQLVVIQQNANQLLKLINQLMDFRKLENKQAMLEAAEGNIVKFIREIYLSFKPYAKHGNYNYTFESSHEDIKAFYDRDKFERVIYNLISNAFKFTREGGSIQVFVKKGTSDLKINIIDSGLGIAPQNLTKIFDRFYQVGVKGKQESSKGTGIGLALAKGIIDLHKGNIDITSEEGKGSNFMVSLPLGSAHLSDDQMIKDFKDSEDLTSYLQQTDNIKLPQPLIDEDSLVKNDGFKTILVVEDNDKVRSFIVELLKNEYNILEAENGKTGLHEAFSEVPDLIISDVMMPEMDGIEFCAEVKSNLKTSHIPFILLTARTSLIFKFEGLESGADAYINKPFNVKELLLKVKNLLKVVDNLKQKFKNTDPVVPGDITISSIDEQLLNNAIQIVNENISNEFFDIMQFCSDLGVSRTMLFTKVKAWTNLTPNEFILSMRMKRAAQLLEQNKMNVSQICYQVGFKNPKYFSKSFQKYYGITPSEYAAKFYTEIT